MADFNSSLPVRTQTNGDVVIFLADGTTPSQVAKVDTHGSQYAVIANASGTATTSQVSGSQQALDVGINVAGVQIDPRQIRALTATDVVTANQGTAAATHASPWWTRLTDGTSDSTLAPASTAATATQAALVVALSPNSPLPTGANVIGSVNQGTSPWITKDAADGSVGGGTAGTFSALAGLIFNSAAPTLTTGQQASLQGDASGNLKVNIAAGSLDVGVADKSAFTYGTSVFQPMGGVFQDTAPTLTAGTTGAARMTTNRGLHVNLRDASGNEKLAQQTSAASIPVVIASDQSAFPIKLEDGAGNAITSATAGSARPLDVALRDSSGNLYTTTNPLPVVVSQNIPGTNINKYNTSVSVAAAASVNHNYAITASKTFTGKKFWISASGKIRADVETSPDGTAFTTFWTGFNSTSDPNISVDLDLLSITDTGTGAVIRIVITNRDLAAFDVFSTISGVEN